MTPVRGDCCDITWSCGLNSCWVPTLLPSLIKPGSSFPLCPLDQHKGKCCFYPHPMQSCYVAQASFNILLVIPSPPNAELQVCDPCLIEALTVWNSENLHILYFSCGLSYCSLSPDLWCPCLCCRKEQEAFFWISVFLTILTSLWLWWWPRDSSCPRFIIPFPVTMTVTRSR